MLEVLVLLATATLSHGHRDGVPYTTISEEYPDASRSYQISSGYYPSGGGGYYPSGGGGYYPSGGGGYYPSGGGGYDPCYNGICQRIRVTVTPAQMTCPYGMVLVQMQGGLRCISSYQGPGIGQVPINGGPVIGGQGPMVGGQVIPGMQGLGLSPQIASRVYDSQVDSHTEKSDYHKREHNDGLGGCYPGVPYCNPGGGMYGGGGGVIGGGGGMYGGGGGVIGGGGGMYGGGGGMYGGGDGMYGGGGGVIGGGGGMYGGGGGVIGGGGGMYGGGGGVIGGRYPVSGGYPVSMGLLPELPSLPEGPRFPAVPNGLQVYNERFSKSALVAGKSIRRKFDSEEDSNVSD